MRIFIAAELSQETLSKIVNLQTELFSKVKNAKLIKKEQLHATLAFFANLRANELKEKIKAFNLTLEGQQQIRFNSNKLLFIPSEKNVRVIAINLESPALIRIQKELATALNYKEKRSFQPHITIARVKNGSTGLGLTEVQFQIGASISKLSLKKSTLTESGPTYENLAEVTLPD